MHKISRLIALLSVITLALGIITTIQAQDDDTDNNNDNSQQTLNVNIAWQPFQNGVMMWFQSTNEIWVLVDDGTPFDGQGSVRYFTNTFNGNGNGNSGSSDCNIDPIRGFGRVYFNNNLENTLGCAMARELGYEGNDNPGSSGIAQLDGPGDTLYEVDRSNNTWTTVRFR